MTAGVGQRAKCQEPALRKTQSAVLLATQPLSLRCGHHSRLPFTCSLLLLFSKPGFFFFLMGLVEVSCGEWPLEECGGLGNFLFWAVLSVEPGSERDTQDQAF